METKNSVLIIHHNDMDGVVGSIVAGTYYENHGDYRIVYSSAAYSNPKLLDQIMEGIELFNPAKIVIVDFSFKPDDMCKILVAVGKENVIWIDHHVGIINTYREDDSIVDQTLIKGLRITVNFSAAELAYMYYFDNTTQPSFYEDKLRYRDDIIIDANKISDRNYVLEKLPKGLKMSGDWDTWRHKETNDYNPVYLNNWFKCHADDIYRSEEYMGVFVETGDEFDDVLNEMVHEGEIIDNYIFMEDQQILQHDSFDAIIIGHEDIHAIAVNANRFTSRVFDEVFDKYEIGIVYVFNGHRNVYSFYRLGENPEKPISCFKIAESFGGGGHASAAGCTVDRKVEVIRVKKS